MSVPDGGRFQLPPLALYIHIPWCVRKCPYCDFNSHAAGPTLPEQEYVDALLADLDADLSHVHGRQLSPIFSGGGTPSLFSAAALGRLLAGVEQRIGFAAEIEITQEAIGLGHGVRIHAPHQLDPVFQDHEQGVGHQQQHDRVLPVEAPQQQPFGQATHQGTGHQGRDH